MTFQSIRKVELEDGRTLVVQYQGDWGWTAHIPNAERVVLARTPAKAMATLLRLPMGRPEPWMREVSAQWEEELRTAERYVCPCCEQRTLLSTGHYDICPVCGWEDDPAVKWDGPDAHSGPNHMSLNEARAEFARLEPRPDERP